MQHNAKKELDIACHTTRRPHILKSNSNIKIKSSNVNDTIHSISLDPTHIEPDDQQDEADYDKSFLSSYEHVSDDEYQPDDDKVSDPAMEGAAILSQLHA
eukprot:5613730-Ditylum_brightwellii.AAC.1